MSPVRPNVPCSPGGVDAPDRRQFLKHVGCLAAAGTGALAASNALANSEHEEAAGGHFSGPRDPFGVLVDLSACIGCRHCEHACKEANGIEPGRIEAYDDASVFRVKRRPATDGFTVVNAYEPRDPSRRAARSAATTTDSPTVYAKVNCVHCNHPACVSACIVGALRKQESGAVTYDAWKCIGCRYCMVACPFQLPAYEYDKVLTPQVRKCQFCHEKLDAGEKPACVAACPREALTFGKRNELIPLAHEKIAAHPSRYVDHVYGEHEVGGTSWMYLSPVPFQQAGFLNVGTAAPPVLTEKIQHGVFKHWIAPITLYSLLLAAFFRTRPREHLVAKAHSALKDGPIAEPTRHAVDHAAHAHADDFAKPIARKLLTPGVWTLISLVTVGIAFWIYRMSVGLAASTNLDQQHPWGLWIAMDVGSGIALAGGGFVSAAIFHVFHRERYHTLARSALVTALLGYTFYVPGLLADLGKWWKLPITMYPPCWQGNSVLFEVGMCVMIYLNVQYAELTPIVCERLLGEDWIRRWPRVHGVVGLVKRVADRMLPALLCLGVALSTFHQSSLGNLLVITPYKLHPLWWSPWSPLFFLLSAIMVGLPMVIFTILFASWSLNREPEMPALAELARKYVPVFIVIYLGAKLADMVWRGTGNYLTDGSYEGVLWLLEMAMPVAALAMFLTPRVRRTPRLLGAASLLVILGVVLNRLSVFVLAFHPPYARRTYIPSLTEFMVSMGLVAALLLVYRVMVTYLPILEPRPKAVTVPA